MNRMTEDALWAAAILGVCLLLVAGFIIGGCMTNNHFHRESIKAGYGQYNPTNGNWEWKPK